ncbi:MAG: Flp pilus assembly complex ATPase component TadA [Candidatus Liptonbacteria bacterium]|nr:Flp pilus assembly complex ATPase component TadA [Candidatus Liptonbacteria bacterium]
MRKKTLAATARRFILYSMAETRTAAVQKKLNEMRREAEERDAERRAQKSGYPYIDLRKIPVSIEAIRLISESDAKEAVAAAVETKKNEVAVAAADPGSAAFTPAIKKLEGLNHEVKFFVASKSGIEKTWELYKFVSAEQKEITGEVDIERERLEGLMKRLASFQMVQDEVKKLDFKNTTTTELLEIVLAGGLAIGASDIHLEAGEKKTKIRFRLDGLLHDMFGDLPPYNYEHLVSRIKLLSGLKINVRDEAQDGRFTVGLTTKEVEVRVSIIPSEFGETIVMRLLDPDSIQADMSGLGLRKDDLELVERQLKKPNGLILNTGPTGSGKTTTLYAFLRKAANPEIKIITIEDPIEYRIEGIEQTQVDPEAGYTFASGLRSILRQDPDVILVGEIRDQETADIALQAALTGHTVYSTLHTNDAAGAVPRLVDLGVKPTSIGPAVNLIIAQRLVRKLCLSCRKKIEPATELQTKIKKFLEGLPARVNREPYGKPALYESAGCEACGGFGYKGRIGIFEFFETGPEFEVGILKEISEVFLKKLAEKQGMVTMQEDGILKVLSGITSFEEVEENTGPIEWQ